jgi:flagellar FliL protein
MKGKGKGTPADEGAGRSGSKLKTIGTCAVLVAVGAVVGPKITGATGAQAGAAAESTTTTEALGPVVTLDAITLNLSDGHLLQVGLALQLAPDATVEEGGKDDPTHGYARAIDAAIEVLGEQTMAGLTAPGGREAAKEAVGQALEVRTHGEVVGVYFHQLVMQ